MSRTGAVLAFLVLALLIVAGILLWKPVAAPMVIPDQLATSTQTSTASSTPSAPARYGDLLEVDVPLANAVVASPLMITGKARGSWYFEASFPVTLLDANGNVLAQGPAQARGDWMTSDYVPFSATLTFSASTATGTLVVKNDNPSGLPENEKEVRIPVTFHQ